MRLVRLLDCFWIAVDVAVVVDSHNYYTLFTAFSFKRLTDDGHFVYVSRT